MSELIEKLREMYRLRGIDDAWGELGGKAADEIDRLQSQLAEARNAGNQALRQWKMYAEMHDPDDDFEKSAEGSVYLGCKAILTGDTGKPSVGAQSGGAAASRLEPLATRLREATVYCTQMQSLESQCLAVAQELELLARDLTAQD